MKIISIAGKNDLKVDLNSFLKFLNLIKPFIPFFTLNIKHKKCSIFIFFDHVYWTNLSMNFAYTGLVIKIPISTPIMVVNAKPARIPIPA